MKQSFWSALGRMSRLYQVFALCYVVVIFRTETAWVTWAANQIHFSFGLVRLWPDDYRKHLRAHLLSERLLMTSLSVLLAMAATVCHLVSSRLSGERKTLLRFWSDSRAASVAVLAALVFGAASGAAATLERHPVPAEVSGLVPTLIFAGSTMANFWVDALKIAVPACVLASFAFGRRTDARFMCICGCLGIAAARVWRTGVSGLPEIVFPLALTLWSNHQKEFEPVRASPLYRVGLAIVAALLGRVGVDIIVMGTMIGAHVVELVLLWLGSVMLAMWLPAAVFTNSVAAMMGLSSAVGVLLYASASVEIEACAKSVLIAMSILQVLCLLCSVVKRVLPPGAALHLACLVSAPLLAGALANATLVNDLAYTAVHDNTIAMGVGLTGAIAHTLVSVLDRSVRSAAFDTFKAATVTVAALLPLALVEAAVRVTAVDVPLPPKIALMLFSMGVLFEHEAALMHHAARCIGVS